MTPIDQPPVTRDGPGTDQTTALAKLIRPRLLNWPVALTFIAIVGLYAGFAMQQYSRLNDLNQRELSNAAVQLERSLDNALETISRISDEQALCEFDKKQPYLALVPPDDRCDQRVSGPLAVSMSDKDDEPLTLNATPRSPSDQRKFKFLANIALGELSFPESFGVIFIADQQGRILYQDAPSKRVWLRHLRWGEQRFRDSAASHEAHSNLGQAKHIFGEDAANGWKRLSAMSGRTTLQLAGDDHAVYFEPLMLERDSRIRFVLGGAVSRRALIRQALAVDSYFLALLVFLLLLACLGLPFIKLLSLNAHERFDLRDVTLLYVSTAALLALFTFAIETVNGYVSWNDKAARGLVQLADRLADDMLKEVNEIKAGLARYDGAVSGLSPKELDACTPLTLWFSGPSSPQMACPKQQAHVDFPLLDTDGQIETVSWIDGHGRQIGKVTADANQGKQAGLFSRLYFRSVRDGHLFTIGDTATPPFHIGPDRSLVNGKFYTFFSMPSGVGMKDAPDQPEPVVVLARTRLLSLRAVPLPDGYGYAVIDRTGRALYHSDPRLALRENLFEEMSAGIRARSIAYAGHPSSVACTQRRRSDPSAPRCGVEGVSFTSAYRERPHAFHMRPLEELRLATIAGPVASGVPGAPAGLFVVTFRDTSLDMATVARTFLQTLCGPGLLLVVIIALSMGVMTLVASRKEEHWSVWLWPNGLAHVYPMISAALVVVLLASHIGLGGGARDVVLMALPIVAIAVAVTIYGCTARRSVTDFSHSTDWHTFMFLLLLMCTIVVPAAAVFRTALGHEFGKRIATEQAWMDAQCTDLPRAIKADVLAEGEPIKLAERLAASATARCAGQGGARDVSPYDFAPAVLSATTHWLLVPYQWADGLLPVSSDYDVRVRYQEPGNSDASSLASGGFPWSTRWGFAGYSAVLAALVWWLRKKAVLLFFADHTSHAPQTTSASDTWASCSPAEQLVLTRVVLDRMVNPYQRPVVVELIRRGVLSLEPHLTPSDELCRFIQGQQVALSTHVRASERVESSHSWRFARGVLVASGVGLAVFLFATQPALQSEFVGIASAVSGGLATLMKLWEAFASRAADRKAAG